MTKTNHSKIISKILSPALQLWLRSQVEQIEQLQVKINGGDRQILGGYIPGVFLASSRAVYQGLHLGQVQLQGENIRINLTQVIRGKPFRLLEPISVTAKVLLEEADLTKSLASPLLSNALTDFLFNLLATKGVKNLNKILDNYQVSWQAIAINLDKLILKGTLTDEQRNALPVIIRSRLALGNPQTLCLHSLQIQILPDLLNVNFNEFQLDLGSQVELDCLKLELSQLSCCGRLTVLP
ncbi:MAG: DUF2993 domain-containing protein [Prochloraceae cyanobacterium]